MLGIFKKDAPIVEGIIKTVDIREIFGEFHLFGNGASSNVFWVRKRKNLQKLALKKMSKKNQMTKQLFITEAQALMNLDHPNIVEYIGAYEDAKNYYIITELCSGGDLLNHIKVSFHKTNKKAQFTEAYAASLIREIIDAVAYCHSKDIVHRDIKPENFVFKTKDKYSNLILIDFGICKKVKENEQYNDFVGTPYYIAPEYLKQANRSADELKAADIWSVGVVAYVLCTGRPPFHGLTNEDVFLKVMKQPLKFPRKAQLSQEGKKFLKNILQKHWSDRPTYQELKKSPWLRGGASGQELDIIDGLVSFGVQSKIREIMNKVVKETKGQNTAQKAFEEIDENGDGTLDLIELQTFLLRNGFAKSQVKKKAEDIMRQIDKDNSGYLDIEEFEQVWVDYQMNSDDKLVALLFDAFDTDGDGHINTEEMKNALGDADEITKAFMVFDDDQNGYIDYDEFSQALNSIGFLKKSTENADIFKIFQREFEYEDHDSTTTSKTEDTSEKELEDPPTDTQHESIL